MPRVLLVTRLSEMSIIPTCPRWHHRSREYQDNDDINGGIVVVVVVVVDLPTILTMAASSGCPVAKSPTLPGPVRSAIFCHLQIESGTISKESPLWQMWNVVGDPSAVCYTQ
jgi:hypothetical protein